MTPKVGIVAGISGVGKTWLLEKVGAAIPMQVLSASSLIQDSLFQTEKQQKSQDHLRARSIDDNQAALLEAFKRHLDPDRNLVILDAHVVIHLMGWLISAQTFSTRLILILSYLSKMIREGSTLTVNAMRSGKDQNGASVL